MKLRSRREKEGSADIQEEEEKKRDETGRMKKARENSVVAAVGGGVASRQGTREFADRLEEAVVGVWARAEGKVIFYDRSHTYSNPDSTDTTSLEEDERAPTGRFRDSI